MKLDRIWAMLALVGLLALPMVVFLVISISSKLAGFKQVTFYRARSSLSAALSDASINGGLAKFVPKQYGYFKICPFTNSVVIEGGRYQCALITVPDYQFYKKGNSAITTNQMFIWLDNRVVPSLSGIHTRFHNGGLDIE